MQEVVFDTNGQAVVQQALDFVEWMKTHNGNPRYVAQTIRWAIPRQRLDGKWAYPVCPDQDYTGMTVEDFDPANYPVEED